MFVLKSTYQRIVDDRDALRQRLATAERLNQTLHLKNGELAAELDRLRPVRGNNGKFTTRDSTGKVVRIRGK